MAGTPRFPTCVATQKGKELNTTEEACYHTLETSPNLYSYPPSNPEPCAHGMLLQIETTMIDLFNLVKMDETGEVASVADLFQVS